MKQTTTYVGIDAHKKDLFIAMLVGTNAAPVSWTARSGFQVCSARRATWADLPKPGIGSIRESSVVREPCNLPIVGTIKTHSEGL